MTLTKLAARLHVPYSARAYTYRVLVAAGAVALAAGKITGEQLPLYLGLAGAVLGLGLAGGETPPSGGRHAAP